MTFDLIIFIVSAVVAVFGATMMIAQRSPVASVLYMILSLVAQAVCYVQLGAFFLGAILVVVYAGAIMVLFLFVIMLLNLRGNEDMGAPPLVVSQFTKLVFGILLALELAFIVKAAPFSGSATGIVGVKSDSFGSVKAVAEKMFTDYLYPFELTGVLLLVAVVGAVVIAKKRHLIETGDSSGALQNDAEVKE
ncbi:MAG: NADH-quinone oxidoreductase subunit J [candidate division Zixibacteria bacterium]|nr:NADH-quinone oxidoreductase subunit J [candidate division Zixibacteria bacterium]